MNERVTILRNVFLPKRPIRSALLLMGLLLLLSNFLAACGGNSTATTSGNVTITLEAPNQWTTSGSSFGPGWDTALAQYHTLHPNVTVKVVVLPLNSFQQTTSTQLSAGTAPDLVFNQVTYKPFMVTSLDSYLNKPNPYAPERGKWIDWFDGRAYGFNNPSSTNADGHLYWVPLNLSDVGLFINQDLFNKVGVPFPIKTFADWQTAVTKFKAAGIVPMGMDNSDIGAWWPQQTVMNMLLAKYYDTFNYFDGSGKAGTNATITTKDLVRAIKTGKMNAELPEMVESLSLLKNLYSNDATPNWSGVKSTSGAGVNLQDFLAGKTAMAWAVNFGASTVADAPFKVGSMGFPTITSDTTPLSQNAPAQFGVTAGGTSYMIPSTTKGDQLKWAVDFLQYMTAPKNSQPWITATTGVPSVQTVTAPPSIAGFSTGDWGTAEKMNAHDLVELTPSEGEDWPQILQGYLLGSTNLATTQASIDATWKKAADQLIKDNNWGSESWAQ